MKSKKEGEKKRLKRSNGFNRGYDSLVEELTGSAMFSNELERTYDYYCNKDPGIDIVATI